MKARILCSASPRSTSSGRLHQRRHRRKMPRLWGGAFLLGRGRTRPGSARLDEPRRFSFGSGRFGESAGTIRWRGRKDPALWPKAHVTRQGGGKRRDPSAILERHCLTRLDIKAFNRLLGQRSDDIVNMAAISAGRFQSQIGRVRQDNPKGPPVSNPWLRCCHHECLCHRVTAPIPAPGSSPGCPARNLVRAPGRREAAARFCHAMFPRRSRAPSFPQRALTGR
jgi:hypothetical protein